MTTTTTDAVREHYERRSGPAHWFESGTMRFFHSRIAENAYVTDDGAYAYFVTSERQDDRHPRLFTVRCYTFATRDISTIGKFQAYASRSGADAAAQRLARHSSGEPVGV